ncbi:unnamed protein product [Lampetra fluviatilis]
MSKHQKKCNPPVASSDDDVKATQDLLPAPRTAVPVIEAGASELAAPGTEEPGAATLHQQPGDGWRMVSVQLDLLRVVVVQLVTLVTETTIAGRAALTSLGRTNQEPGVELLARTSTSTMAAITRGREDAHPEATITGDPSRDGEPKGWSPRNIVVQLAEESCSKEDIVAALPMWSRRREDAARRQRCWRLDEQENRTLRRHSLTCFHCDQPGHFTQGCQNRRRTVTMTPAPTAPPTATSQRQQKNCQDHIHLFLDNELLKVTLMVENPCSYGGGMSDAQNKHG